MFKKKKKKVSQNKVLKEFWQPAKQQDASAENWNQTVRQNRYTARLKGKKSQNKNNKDPQHKTQSTDAKH